MNLGNINFGQRLAAIGAIVLLLSMTVVDWYDVVAIDHGFSAFYHPGFTGGFADVLIIAACVIAIGTAVLAATSRSVGLPVAMNALTCLGGAGAMVLVFGRMILQPGPNKIVELKLWIAVAFFAAACIAYGGWISMRDETARDAVSRASGSSPAPGQPQA
jgi:hypothetical protein